MHNLCEERSISLRDEIDQLQSDNRTISFQTMQQKKNEAILNFIKPNPLHQPQPGSGALAIGLIGMALCGSIETEKHRHRYSGVCPRCGAPVDPYVAKCSYCDCYYD